MSTRLPYTLKQRLLTIENLGVRYDRPVLEGVNGAIDNIHRDGVQQGQVVGLLGPSGIGKSQLFRCIAGLQRPSTGAVKLNGSSRPVLPGEVGVVAQNYPLFNHRTVWGNLLVAARRKTPHREEAAQRCLGLLDDFGLAELAPRYPMALSGGQRQRVAIAQQLLCSSHFLLLDEPFSGLDPLAKNQVCDTLLKVSTADELNTIIVVTHDIEAAVRICDTIWVLGRERDAAGRPVSAASIRETYNLAEMGLAWRDELESLPEYAALCAHLKRRFEAL